MLVAQQLFNRKRTNLHEKYDDPDPVRMVDERGAEHDFQFCTRLFGPGMANNAFELRDGSPAGYEFQVIGEPDDDPLELLGKLIGKMFPA